MNKVLRCITPLLLKHYHNNSRAPRFLDPVNGTEFLPVQVGALLKSKRLIYFGEIHGVENIVSLQESVLDFLVSEVRDENSAQGDKRGEGDCPSNTVVKCEANTSGVGEENLSKVVIIMEHFAGPRHQKLLDQFMGKEITDACETENEDDDNDMSIENLLSKYREEGDEGHNLVPYVDLLEFAQQNSDVVEVKAGFIPRSYARMLMKEGEEKSIEAALTDGYLDPQRHYITGSDNHYNFFESLISGRNMLSLPPHDRFRKIFPAQVLKDSAMAYMVVKEIIAHGGCNTRSKFLVICGQGHCDYRFGVPERVDAANVIQKQETCIITARSVLQYESDCGNVKPGELTSALACGPFEQVKLFENPFPADVIFLYEDDQPEEEWDQDALDAHTAPSDENSSDAQIKSEIASAYNEVGATAHLEGDSALAYSVMKFLDYTDEHIRIAGRDAFNYQGVGNPHKHADIETGNHVLDLGSGLGIDSFIAASRVGATGKVTGLDISKGEVVHASRRAKARGVDDRVGFMVGDMEKIPLDDASIDVVISNGAFCLAPNKKKSFEEIFRVLKPGGHFSVACTTLLKDLETEVNWPICMRVFMPLGDAEPMLTEVGFENVQIDSSNSLMEYRLEVPNSENTRTPPVAEECSQDECNTDGARVQEVDRPQGGRKRIHVGSEEFKHLENFDMNELCARVILYGKKPGS